MAGVDTTIVNLGLPAIGRALHAATSDLQWTIDAYTLVLASLLMTSGALADRIGRKRTFQAGFVVFALGSLLCSLAPDFGVLVAARMLQASGASMLNPVAMSIIRNVFTDQRERARAIGAWGSVIGISMALGPVIGGVLVNTLGWRSIFWLNIPVSIVAVILTHRFVPESKAANPRPVDPLAQLLLFTALGTITFSLIEGPRVGWTSVPILLLLCSGFALAFALVRVELHRAHPLVDPRYFRSVPLVGASLVAAASYACFGGFLFLNSLYLQETRGMSALAAGITTLPMAAMTILIASLSGRLVARAGTRISMSLGGLCLLVGSALMIGVTGSNSWVRVVVAYATFGGGFGAINPPINETALSSMPSAQAGVAAAIASTSRQVGQTLGVALLGTTAAAAPGLRTLAPLGSWPIPTAFAGIVFVAGFASTGKWALATAHRVRERLPGID